MDENNYIYATHHPWNIDLYHSKVSRYPGNWTLITEKKELTVELVNKLKPRYIFFPHWSYIVPKNILDSAECICFHTAKLPHGRGGSPVQNQIVRGFKESEVCALRMTEEVDAGPVYMRRPVSLEGLAEEIYLRIASIISEMILEMIENHIEPEPQEGNVVSYDRRKPSESEIPAELELEKLFDFIRMLDAESYPRAFIRYGNYRLEFTRPALRKGRIEADVKITMDENNDNINE